MVLSEFFQALRDRGLNITDTQYRFAVKSNRIPKPRLDASHRFDFTAEDVNKTVEYFANRPTRQREVASCRT